MPACSVTSVNCMGPVGRSGERNLAGSCASLGDVSVTAAVGIAAVSETSAAIMLLVTDAASGMGAERGTPVLQPAAATTDVRKKDNVKARARIRNSSRGNGRTGGTCASRIQPHLDQHGRRSHDKQRIKRRIHHLI